MKSKELFGKSINIFFISFLSDAEDHNQNRNFRPFDPINDPISLADGPDGSTTEELSQQRFSLLLWIFCKGVDSISDFLLNTAIGYLGKHFCRLRKEIDFVSQRSRFRFTFSQGILFPSFSSRKARRSDAISSLSPMISNVSMTDS